MSARKGVDIRPPPALRQSHYGVRDQGGRFPRLRAKLLDENNSLGSFVKLVGPNALRVEWPLSRDHPSQSFKPVSTRPLAREFSTTSFRLPSRASSNRRTKPLSSKAASHRSPVVGAHRAAHGGI